MKLNLNLQERFIFLQLMPQENDFSTLRIVRKVIKDLAPSDEDYKEYEIKQNPNGPGIIWDQQKGSIEIEFEIGEIAHQLAKSALEKLDKEKKLTPEHLTLYEKIVMDSNNQKGN